MYLIKRNDGAYVAQPGCKASYTHILKRARPYDSKETAEADKCGNETVVSAYDELPR